MLLRAGAELIETNRSGLGTHARIMRQAANEIEALALEVQAAITSLEISQRHVGDLERMQGS